MISRQVFGKTFLLSLATAIVCLSSLADTGPSDAQCQNFVQRAIPTLMALNNEMIAPPNLVDMRLVSSDDTRWKWVWLAYKYTVDANAQKRPIAAPYIVSVTYVPFAPGAGNCRFTSIEVKQNYFDLL